MNAFIVELPNKPGELARLAETISQKGINITTIAGTTTGESGAITLMTNDEAGTRAALTAAGLASREIEAVPVTLEDRPGTLAAIARQLATAGINIESIVPTGMSGGKQTVALMTSDPARTRSILEQAVPTRA
jgi:hypothetical protein